MTQTNYSKAEGKIGRTLQNKVEVCCTLFRWLSHIVAPGGLCTPTNECSKGEELLATGQLSNSSPNHNHTHPTHIQMEKHNLPAIVLLC